MVIPNEAFIICFLFLSLDLAGYLKPLISQSRFSGTRRCNLMCSWFEKNLDFEISSVD